MPGSAPPRLDWVVLKIVQRCNLDCTYCYVYNRGDESWRTRPGRISEAVLVQLAYRIDEQCSRYGLDEFTVELHGGEPLLLGRRRMRELLQTLRQHVNGPTLRIVMQTNGLLLDERWLELLEEFGVTFGLSLDGPPEIADRRRIRRNGRGSTGALLARVQSLRAASPRFDRLNSGVLCVLDPDADGAALVRWFADQGFRGLDFLLPDGNWDNPPTPWRGSDTCARVLLEAFDAWLALGRDGPRIRIFEVMMMGLMQVRPHLDAFGGDLRGLCVVESDGGIGVIDTIRLCGGRFARDEIDVFSHPLDAHGEHYGLAALQVPCATCRCCAAFAACRGGYLPHRFRNGGFAQPSVHCASLYALAMRMADVLLEHLPPSAIRRGAAAC